MSVFKYIIKIILEILKVLSILFVFIIIGSIALYYYYPTTKVINYTKEETLSLINKDIVVTPNEIKNILFSQSMYMTFLGDGGYDIIVELTQEGVDRILSSKKTHLGDLVLKDISELSKCSFIDYENDRKVIEIKSDFVTGEYYYVGKEEMYKNEFITGGTYIYIDDKINTMYYCTYRN